jgi:hypothetical protein
MRKLEDVGLRARWRGQYPLPTDSQIQQFEAEFGLNLPEDYVRFLKYLNGGRRPRLAHYVDPASGGIEGVEEFYGLGSKEADDAARRPNSRLWDAGNLWGETRMLRDVFGIQGVPFAGDGGGNRLFLAYDARPSKICRLIIATRRTHDIAHTFAEFVDMLMVPSRSVESDARRVQIPPKFEDG